ncbi:MAG: MarR family transcriptional regulator [Nanoarchaeota archaeon]
MENKNVGWLIIGIAAVVIAVIFIFNSALKDIVKSSCGLEHSLICPMNETIKQQTYLALAIVSILVIIGLVLILSKQKDRIIIRKIKEKVAEKIVDLSKLNKEEKNVFNIVKENRAIFQAELIEKSGLGKAKITRILDRLEGQSLIERKRRGMNNVVVIKED